MKPHHLLFAAAALTAGLAMAQTNLRSSVNPPVATSRSTVGILNLRSVPVDERSRPAPEPPANRHVQVMKIALTVENGKVSEAKVLSSTRLNSIAPKVFLRRAGDWTVTIEGEEERTFYVNNPGIREAEAGSDSGNAYEWIAETGTMEWPLIVPLYDGDMQIDAKSIVIRDVRTRKVILKTDLDRTASIPEPHAGSVSSAEPQKSTEAQDPAKSARSSPPW